VSEDLDLDGWDAQVALGGKVMEMAERLKTADAVVPGAVATYTFEMDDVPFKITMTMPKANA
jgi:hypothetical protein